MVTPACWGWYQSPLEVSLLAVARKRWNGIRPERPFLSAQAEGLENVQIKTGPEGAVHVIVQR
jgi:hypothetical protein